MALLTIPKAPRQSAGKGRTRHDTVPREADASLMVALLRKEPAAAEELYARYASRIYGLGLVLLRNKADAEDLVQDTFLKVWRTGSRFDSGRGSLDVWILLIARSLAIDLLRRRNLEPGICRPSRATRRSRWSLDRSGTRSTATSPNARERPWTGSRRASALP
jgi:DNA-directed RNA polymerase specialized sigma24 family protein